MVGIQYTIYHWAINRSDPQNLLSITLDVLLQPPPDNKTTTILSSNKSIVLASKNPNIQLSEEVNNLITFLK